MWEVILQIDVNGVLGGIPWMGLAGFRTMACGIEVEILLDSRLLDGEEYGERVSFFPYFSSSF